MASFNISSKSYYIFDTSGCITTRNSITYHYSSKLAYYYYRFTGLLFYYTFTPSRPRDLLPLFLILIISGLINSINGLFCLKE